MGNVTLDLNVVRRLGEPSPVPGHDLLIFDRVETEGRVYRRTVHDGEPFKKRWMERLFKRGRDPVAYAVSRDRTFAHTVAFLANPQEGSSPLSIEVQFSFAVDNARTLVERLDQDPVGALAGEAKTLARRAVRRLSLLDVAHRRVRLEDEILRSQSPGPEGEATRHIDQLTRFARATGLDLRGVRVAHQLPEDALPWVREPLKKEVERVTKDGKLRAEEDEAELRQRKMELELRETRLRDQLAQAEEQRVQLRHEFEQIRRLREAAADALKKGMLGAVGTTDSARKLGELAQTILNLPLTTPGASIPAGPSQLLSPAEADGHPALVAGARTVGRLEEKVSSAVQLADEISCGEDQREAFLAISLHLLAEASRRDAANLERVGEWKSELDSLLDALERAGAFQTVAQLDQASAWGDFDALRSDLSAGGA